MIPNWGPVAPKAADVDPLTTETERVVLQKVKVAHSARSSLTSRKSMPLPGMEKRASPNADSGVRVWISAGEALPVMSSSSK